MGLLYSSSFFSRPSPVVVSVLVLFVSVLLCPSPRLLCSASEGDRDPRMHSCVYSCLVKMNSSSVTPFYLKYMGWDCKSDCEYHCMRNHTELRKKQGLPVVQYHGKWPFWRILGLQELFSVIFSLGNGAVSAVYFFRFNNLVPSGYHLKNLALIFAITNTITWLCSAIFHARDLPLTQALDYYMADVTWAFMSAWTTIRVFGLRSNLSMLLVVSFFSCIIFYLIYYLTFVTFDYGYNIKVAICLAGWQSALWLWWSFLNWSKHKHARSMVLVQCLTWLAGSLEIFDFAPIFFDLLDAHAMWHAATIYIGVLLWEFLIEDSRRNCERILEEDNQKLL